MKDQYEKLITDRKQITEVIKDFYTTLYSSTGSDPTTRDVYSKIIPQIREALKQTKKYPGDDNITEEMQKVIEYVLEMCVH